MKDTMTMADLLSARLRDRGFDRLADFHRALGSAGLQISYSSVHAWRDGIARIDPEHIPTVAKVLELSPEDRLALHELPLSRKKQRKAS
jgi:hypothetical protein